MGFEVTANGGKWVHFVYSKLTVEKEEGAKLEVSGKEGSESVMSGKDCLTLFRVEGLKEDLQQVALKSEPDKAKALFELLEQQTMVTVEKSRSTEEFAGRTNFYDAAVLRFSGYKLTITEEAVDGR